MHTHSLEKSRVTAQQSLDSCNNCGLLNGKFVRRPASARILCIAACVVGDRGGAVFGETAGIPIIAT